MDRYKVIVERSPFGKTEAAGGALSATVSNFLARFAFVGVVGLPDNGQIAVILDKAVNESFFKSPGETIGDVVVERIEDVKPKRRLLLRRGIETGALVFGEGAPAVSVPTMARHAPTPTPPMPGVPSGDAPVVRRRVPFIR
jgi:hypothetical protein